MTIYISDGRNKQVYCIMFYRLFCGVIISVTAILYAAHHGGGGGGDGEKEPGHNQELVTKRGTTSVAWTRVFKHCRFKTTDSKPMKLKQQSYMRAPFLFQRERSKLYSCRFIGFWTIT